MSDDTRPFCLCLAGPNGSGKSTFTKRIRQLHPLDRWIDPDVVAASIGDEATAFAAARNQRVEFAQDLLDFGFETVFSHISNADFLDALKTLGYAVHIYFVCTDDPAINVGRVKNRVRLGGHDVPENKIVERYGRALENLLYSVKKFDRIVLIDNSSANGRVQCFDRLYYSGQARAAGKRPQHGLPSRYPGLLQKHGDPNFGWP